MKKPSTSVAVAMNTGVPDGTRDLTEIWHEFAEKVATAETLDIGRLIGAGCVMSLLAETRAAHDVPFPDESYKAGARRFPALIPQSPDDNGAEAMVKTREHLGEWNAPAFVVFSDSDPIFRENRDPLRDLIPSASDQPDVWIEGAGHFLQEDAGEDIAREIVEFVDRTSPPT